MKTLIATSALASLALASTAFAQAPAPAAAAVGGPPVAGVCTYFRDGALVNSQVGKSTIERLKQLTAVVDAELTKEGSELQAEQQSLQALTGEQRQQPANQQRIQNFQQRAANFERLRELRAKEIEATQNKQFGAIQGYIQPILSSVATSKSCGLLLERSGLYWANPSMDVTDSVVTQLNAKVSALPAFDREHLDQQTGAAAPAAAPPRPAAATTKKSH